MRLLFSYIIISMLLIFANDSTLSAQGSTPLKPKLAPNQKEVGLVLGVGQNLLLGSFSPDCPNCLFEQGNRLGYTIGMVYDHEFTETWKWGFTALFHQLGFESAYREIEDIALEISDTKTETVALKFRHLAEVDMSTFAFSPYIKWAPSSWFFLRLGITPYYIFSSNLTHSKELLQKTAVLSDGQSVTVEIPGSDNGKTILQSGEFRSINTFGVNLDPAIGLNFQMGDFFRFSPVFQYSIPLNNISSTENNFKISSWRIFAEIRLALRLRKSITK